VPLNFVIKFFRGTWVIPALITAGVRRPEYLGSTDWLGAPDAASLDGGALVRALMLPTGAPGAMFDVMQHTIPWR
jgi:hypothetical protein